MIDFNFKYKGEKIKAQAPSNWQEMKVKHYINLETTKSPIELLAFVSDIELNKVLNTNQDLGPVLNLVVKALNRTPPNFKNIRPSKKLTIEGKTIKIPSDLNKSSFGQIQLIGKYLHEAENDERKALPGCMAVIVQPLADGGDFDLERAEYYKDLINEMPVINVLPNIYFFLPKLIELIGFGELS